MKSNITNTRISEYVMESYIIAIKASYIEFDENNDRKYRETVEGCCTSCTITGQDTSREGR
jgi:hypothetical protein